jgi:hypothetical protein
MCLQLRISAEPAISVHLEVKLPRSFETAETIYQITWCHNLEDRSVNLTSMFLKSAGAR